jgi:hypothetical protein
MRSALSSKKSKTGYTSFALEKREVSIAPTQDFLLRLPQRKKWDTNEENPKEGIGWLYGKTMND